MRDLILKAENISFAYDSKRPILKEVTFSIHADDFIALAGSSGSGKSTLIKHLNGLIRAQKGQIYYRGQNIYDKKFEWTGLRKKVGLVFQYPETQLFKPTVIQDTMYGPLNMGLSEAQARERAQDSLSLVGLDEELFSANPSELSGGQKRCVAIAGVLAMQPEVLVLDEPTAGLDPQTVSRIFKVLQNIHVENNCAILFVSHRMDEIEQYTKTMWVLDEGRIIMEGQPREIFKQVDELEAIGINAPIMTHFSKRLIDKGFPLDDIYHNEKELFSHIKGILKKESELDE